MSFYLNTFYVVLSMVFAVGWTFPFLLTPLIGIKFYVFTENKVGKLIKRLPKYASVTRNDDAEGWIIGWPFIGYVYHTRDNAENNRELYIVTTPAFIQKHLTAIETIQTGDSSKDKSTKPATRMIHVLEREGGYSHLYYIRRRFDVQPFKAMENQESIVREVVEYYKTHRHVVVILHGEKGVGKSMIPLLVAKELAEEGSADEEDTRVSFCDTHRPTDPGDCFVRLYTRADPMKPTPLIVTMEEFDGMLQAVHHGTVKQHDDMTTEIYDKATWNQFFDRFDRGYYPWTILFLTTNQDPEVFHRMDPSYLREGRVNLTFHVKETPESVKCV